MDHVRPVIARFGSDLNASNIDYVFSGSSAVYIWTRECHIKLLEIVIRPSAYFLMRTPQEMREEMFERLRAIDANRYICLEGQWIHIRHGPAMTLVTTVWIESESENPRPPMTAKNITILGFEGVYVKLFVPTVVLMSQIGRAYGNSSDGREPYYAADAMNMIQFHHGKGLEILPGAFDALACPEALTWFSEAYPSQTKVLTGVQGNMYAPTEGVAQYTVGV